MNIRLPVVLLAGLLLLGFGVVIGRLFAPGDPVGSSEAAAESAAGASTEADNGEPEVLYWYDPMVPDQHFDQPGKSPFMDMMLVPRYADEAGTAGVSIEPGLRQNLGIRTTTVERGRLQQTLVVPGTLDWDRRAEQRVSARVDGIVDRLHVATPYQRVRRGEALATLLAPEWTAALAEYRALAESESDEGRALVDAARTRLRAMGLSPADIDAGNAADGVPRVTLRAPIDGVLSAIDAREGERVMAGQTLFRINGTGQIWMLAEVPQRQASPSLVGSTATVTVDALGGVRFEGELEALLPDVNPTTRSQTARIVLNDPDAQLAAGMFAEARLQPAAGEAVTLLPSEALIESGRGARVILLQDDGSFLPVEVEVGQRGGDQVEILDGLEGGERVVVSGQFLIDSEASFSGLLRRLEDSAGDEDAGGSMDHGMHHGHEDHQMPADPDPHAGHDMSAADEEDPHAGHVVPAKEDPHAGHDMSAMDLRDPHAGHDMSGGNDEDPHAAHRISGDEDPHAGHDMSDADEREQRP